MRPVSRVAIEPQRRVHAQLGPSAGARVEVVDAANGAAGSAARRPFEVDVDPGAPDDRTGGPGGPVTQSRPDDRSGARRCDPLAGKFARLGVPA